MSQIKHLLQLQSRGVAKKTIARNLGISKNAEKSYLGKLAKIVSMAKTIRFLFLVFP